MGDANPSELVAALRLGIAALVGLAVGIERERSGHATGPQGHFAGIRTFFQLGVLGGGAGLLFAWDYALAGTALLAAAGAFVVIAYLMAVRRPGADLDGTTEGAALVVLMLGTLAGVGQIVLAGGAVTLVVLALGEKKRLHWFVRHIGEREMRATLQFLVLALIVLPLLPEGPYASFGGVRPRALWSIVVLFSGLNFAGYLARRAVGPERGYGIAGLLGGIISSTAVAFQFARISRREPELGAPLAFGVIAACTMLLPRVAVMSAILNPPVSRALVPLLLPPLVVGCGALAIGLLRRRAPSTGGDAAPETQSPLRLWSAIQMAAVFQVAITLLTLVRDRWGSPGVLVSAAALGMTDVDALTVSMSGMSDGAGTVALAAAGMAVGIVSNTVFKILITLIVGSGRFRRVAATGLGALALATALGLWLALSSA